MFENHPCLIRQGEQYIEMIKLQNGKGFYDESQYHRSKKGRRELGFVKAQQNLPTGKVITSPFFFIGRRVSSEKEISAHDDVQEHVLMSLS